MMMRFAFTPLLMALTLFGGQVWAQSGNAEKGEAIYLKRCVMCHGEEGEGDGPAAERLNPPPRDFTLGQYKIKTSPFGEDYPEDADIKRMIRDGMPGTAMPGWSDVLKDSEIEDLVAYLIAFAEIEEPPEEKLDYGTQVASSAESIEKGRKLFFQDDRCSECHGEQGKGNGVKKLKDDDGARTWPRNLTKPWTFRASNDARDIFSRVSVGIPGTQMPSFADPKSKKKLSIEDRWHVANFAASLAKTVEVVRPENTVIRADRIDGEVPASPDDPRWLAAAPSTFFLVPQIIAKERFFTPANDTITVRAAYNDKDIAILLEWDDRTKSIPGVPEAEKIAEVDMGEDAVAVQLPLSIPEDMEKPYFLMGDASNPVNLWKWNSGTSDTPEGGALMNATGYDKVEARDAAKAGLSVKGMYDKGTWRVVMKRPLAAPEAGKDIQFVEGKFIPIAFFNWDGSNGEKGSKHTLTTWYWLLLAPPEGMTPYFYALIVIVLVGAGELWWARGAAPKSGGSA